MLCGSRELSAGDGPSSCCTSVVRALSLTRLAFRAGNDDDDTILAAADVVLSAFDSTMWLISGPDEVIDRFFATFEDVTEIPPGRGARPPLRA